MMSSMSFASSQPHADDHKKLIEFLDRLTPAENEALLRRSGIIDEAGRLAARYKAGGDPVIGTESSPRPPAKA